MAVFTDISDAEAREFLIRYDLGRFERLVPIVQGVENTNYHLFTDAGHYILTIFEGRTDTTALPFFFTAMDHWRAKGVTCPQGLTDRHGAILQSLRGKPAALLSFLSGRGVVAEEITPILCGQVGVLMARMHLAGRDFVGTRANTVSLAAWQILLKKCAGRADEVASGLSAVITQEMQMLESWWPRMAGLPAGLIHADLFPDNVFIDDAGAICGVIDFYFSCTDAYIYDLAIAVNAWCFNENFEFEDVRFSALMKGYVTQRALSPDEVAAWPMVARAAALRFLLSRLHDYLFRPEGALVTPKDPRAFLARLQFFQDTPDALGRVMR